MRTLVMLLAAMLAACGQTGSLYLPDAGVETPVEIRPGPAAAAEPGDTESEEPHGGTAPPPQR